MWPRRNPSNGKLWIDSTYCYVPASICVRALTSSGRESGDLQKLQRHNVFSLLYLLHMSSLHVAGVYAGAVTLMIYLSMLFLSAACACAYVAYIGDHVIPCCTEKNAMLLKQPPVWLKTHCSGVVNFLQPFHVLQSWASTPQQKKATQLFTWLSVSLSGNDNCMLRQLQVPTTHDRKTVMNAKIEYQRI